LQEDAEAQVEKQKVSMCAMQKTIDDLTKQVEGMDFQRDSGAQEVELLRRDQGEQRRAFDEQKLQTEQDHMEAIEEVHADYQQKILNAVEEAKQNYHQQLENEKEDYEETLKELNEKLEDSEEALQALLQDGGGRVTEEAVAKNSSALKTKISSNHGATRHRDKPQDHSKKHVRGDSTGETPEKPLGFLPNGAAARSSSSNVDSSPAEKAEKAEKPKKQVRRPSTLQGLLT